MADLDYRYPFSTADGKAIPLDIVRPHGTIKKSFTNASPTAALSCPSTIEVFSILTTADCIVKFAASSASAAALSDGVLATDTIYIPADILTVISPPIGKKSFSIIGDSETGTAIIQFFEKWSGLSLQSQQNRR